MPSLFTGEFVGGVPAYFNRGKRWESGVYNPATLKHHKIFLLLGELYRIRHLLHSHRNAVSRSRGIAQDSKRRGGIPAWE